jgi:menaquinone-9 beta-reductase
VKSTDILIVGGGPAGLAAAIALRQQGAEVTVADAQGPCIDKVCGEGMMPDSLEELAKLGVDLSAAGGADFHGIQFAGEVQDGDGPRGVASPFPSGHGIGVRRLVLHKQMAERAREAGVALHWGNHVQLERDGSVTMGGERVRYGCVVGADGQSSRVRQWAGLEASTMIGRRFGFRQHFAVDYWSPYVEVHWGRSCQAYVAPVAPGEVCVVAMARDSRLRMEEALKELPWLEEKLRGGNSEMSALNAARGCVMTTRRLRHVVARGKVALVGDASGSVDAITGEGLALGFRQALLLAECLGAGDVAPGLAKYDRLHPAIMTVPQTMARAMLLMDRWPILRKRALRMLTGEPALFAGMLGVHVGSQPILRFVAAKGPELAWRLLMPPRDESARMSLTS